MNKFKLSINDNEYDIQYTIDSDVFIPENRRVYDITIEDCENTVYSFFKERELENLIYDNVVEKDKHYASVQVCPQCFSQIDNYHCNTCDQRGQ